MPHARFGERTNRSRTDLFRRRAVRKFLGEFFRWYRKKVLERGQGPRIRRAVIEHAKHPREGESPAACFGEKAFHAGAAVVRHDLREIKLGVHTILEQVLDL